MKKMAIIGGTFLLESEMFSEWGRLSIETPYGIVDLRRNDDHFFLQRHGNPPVPPHRINHKANIHALVSLGVESIISINSTGSLRKEITPGGLVIPDDFISFWDIPTFFDDTMHFAIPGLNDELREVMRAACGKLGVDVRYGGIYIQTRGPRFETKSEIALLRNYGDLVGMTMGSEATLAIEREIPYAAVCSVDNFCHGIVEKPLTMDEIMNNVQKNRSKIESILKFLQRVINK